MIDRLKEYIEKDEIYQAYKEDKLINANDFDKFCIQRCKDIEELLEENKYLRMELEEKGKCLENRIYNLETDLKKYEKENKWLKDIINSILHI